MKFNIKKWKNFIQESQGSDCSINTNCNCIDNSYHAKFGVGTKDVQLFLYKNGYKDLLTKTFNPLKPDGYCGPETKNAIMAFQRDKNLKKCDACVGPETWSAMLAAGFQPPKNNEKSQSQDKIESEKELLDQSKIINKKIADGVWYIGSSTPRPGMVTLHIVGSGKNQDPSIVSKDMFSKFKSYVSSEGDLLVSMYGNKYLTMANNFINVSKYSKTRIVGFSRGARSPGGAWDYALYFGKSSDELILLDPSVGRNIKDSRIPSVSSISLYCGSEYMAKTFKQRWNILKQRLSKLGIKGTVIDEPSKTPGFSGHLGYYNNYYNNPSILNTSENVSSTSTPSPGEASASSNLDKSKPYVLPFDLPMSSFNSIRISGFGEQRARNKHAGVDYYVPNGTPVYAIASGQVSKTYFVGNDKYEKMTKWLLNKIKDKYNFELALIVKDYRRILGSSSRKLYSVVAKTEGVPHKESYYELRNLFKGEDSPYRHLTMAMHGRWWGGVQFRLDHLNLEKEENPLGLRFTRYLHMQEIYVKPGDFVKKGQLIGTVGRSGIFESFDHLHLEIYAPDLKGRAWLQDPKYVGVSRRPNT